MIPFGDLWDIGALHVPLPPCVTWPRGRFHAPGAPRHGGFPRKHLEMKRRRSRRSGKAVHGIGLGSLDYHTQMLHVLYGIFTYISPKTMVNICKHGSIYSIHGAYILDKLCIFWGDQTLQTYGKFVGFPLSLVHCLVVWVGNSLWPPDWCFFYVDIFCAGKNTATFECGLLLGQMTLIERVFGELGIMIIFCWWKHNLQLWIHETLAGWYGNLKSQF